MNDIANITTDKRWRPPLRRYAVLHRKPDCKCAVPGVQLQPPQHHTLQPPAWKIGRQFFFRKNKYSTYNDRVHFTSIWFPDRKNYTVYVEIFDVWCPAGQLSVRLTDQIFINGSVYNDWHIGPDKAVDVASWKKQELKQLLLFSMISSL